MHQGAGALVQRSVIELLHGALYDGDRGASLIALVEEVGDIVERNHLLTLVADAFPDVASHRDFAAEGDACVDLIASTLGLLPWQGSWLVTQESVLREVRDSLRIVDFGTVPRQLRIAGPSLTDHHALIVALLREMPDEVDEVDVPGPDGTPLRKGTTRSIARSSPSKRVDPRWRPSWWQNLRSWSAENGFALERIDATRERKLSTYVDRIHDLLASDETLHAAHWKGTFLRSAELRMSEVERIEAHAHIVAGLVHAVVRQSRRSARGLDSAYELLTRQAFLLGMADHVVDMALHPDVTEPSTVVIDRGMRIGATVGPGIPLDEVLAVHALIDEHAAALGLMTGGVARATQVVAVTRWDLESRAVAKALRYRIPLVLIDDLLAAGMRDELECRVVTFPALRAAACGRCGILHTRPGRSHHRLDALCDGCR